MSLTALTKAVVYNGTTYPIGATSYPLAAVYGPAGSALFLSLSGPSTVKGYFVDGAGNRTSGILSGTIPAADGTTAPINLIQAVNLTAAPVKSEGFRIVSLSADVYVDYGAIDDSLRTSYTLFSQIPSFTSSSNPIIIPPSGQAITVNSTGGGGGGAATLADGADVNAGATTDAAVTGDTAGSLSAKQRGLSKMFFDVYDGINHRLKVRSLDGDNVTQGALADTGVTGDNSGSMSAKLRGVNTLVLVVKNAVSDTWDQTNHWFTSRIFRQGTYNTTFPTLTNGQSSTQTQIDATAVEYVNPLALNLSADSVGTAPYLGTTGGVNIAAYENDSLSNTKTTVRTTPINIHGGQIDNSMNTAAVFVSLFDALAASVTVGSTPATKTLKVPGGQMLNLAPNALQRSFVTGLVIAAVTSLNGSGAPVNPIFVSFDRF